MQLTLFTDISLKSIMYLKQSDRIVTINELVAIYGISKNHLIKSLNFMVHKKWIKSVRGRNGGLIYDQKSDNLKIGDVIRILEGDDELLDCESCILSRACNLRGLLAGATESFYRHLNQYTLKELSNPQTINFLQILNNDLNTSIRR
jgi:Rrf2 family nitric oxide-sensitive transcriptional repressor